MKRNRTLEQRQAGSAMLVGLLGTLSLWGCSPQVEKGQPTGPTTVQAPAPQETTALTQARFLELLKAGLADRTDLTSVISDLVGSSKPQIEPLTEASDPYRLKFWKGVLEDDEFLETSNLGAFKLWDVNAGLSDVDDTSTVLFIQLRSSPDWIYWVRQRRDGASIRFDLAVPPSTLNGLIHAGLSDKTDLSGTISELFSLETQKKSDPELTQFTLISSTEVTDEARLKDMKGLLEGDSTLIPSRIRAIKAFDLEIEETFQPARPANGHGDVPHDGKNSLLILFVKSKLSEEWTYWGSYI